MKRAPKGLIYTILAGDKPVVALEANGREAASFVRKIGFKLNCQL
jgi:hypothetical protein